MEKIQRAVRQLGESREQIAAYFDKARRTPSKLKGEIAQGGDDIKEFEEVPPYVLCKDVSVSALNAYIDSVEEGCEEASLIRFMELDSGGTLQLIEFPVSAQHENIAGRFEIAFVSACGSMRYFASKRKFTARRGGAPGKQPDASYGPGASTPRRGPPPQGVHLSDWATLVVEVGWSQSAARLRDAAKWWALYAGVEYILCIKVVGPYASCSFWLYDLSQPRGDDDLPEPYHGNFVVEPGNHVPVTFDAHRLLAIPGGQPLPEGVNGEVTVD